MFSQPAGRRVAIVVASLVVLCGRGASAYQETVVANGGRIVGTVRVAGDITPLPPQPVFKEKEFCSESVPDERLVVDPAGHLGGAVVHLAGIEVGQGSATGRGGPPRQSQVRLRAARRRSQRRADARDARRGSVPARRARAASAPETLFNLAHPEGPHGASGAERLRGSCT